MATGESEIKASEARCRELGKLNLLVRKLQTECVTVGNDVIGDMAAKIVSATVAICDAERVAHGELPVVSMEAASLEIPLQLLDTPNQRRLLSALAEAHAAALAVDYERGYGDDGPAQDLEDWVCKVREEIHGPAGGRE